MSWKFGFSSWKSHWCPLKMSTHFHKSQLFQLNYGNFPARHSGTTAPCGPCSLARLSQMHWTWGQLLHSWRTVPGCSWKHALERGMRSADRWGSFTHFMRKKWASTIQKWWHTVDICGCEIPHQLVYGLSMFIPQSHYVQCFIVTYGEFGEFPQMQFNMIQTTKVGVQLGFSKEKLGLIIDFYYI